MTCCTPWPSTRSRLATLYLRTLSSDELLITSENKDREHLRTGKKISVLSLSLSLYLLSPDLDLDIYICMKHAFVFSLICQCELFHEIIHKYCFGFFFFDHPILIYSFIHVVTRHIHTQFEEHVPTSIPPHLTSHENLSH
jgi:hypothetical protein